MVQFIYKEVNLTGTDDGNKMLQTLVHNLYEEYCSEFQPSHSNYKKDLKRSGVRSKYCLNKLPVYQLKEDT